MTQREVIRLGIRSAISALLFLLFVLQVNGSFGHTLLDRLEDASYDARLLLTLPNTKDPRVVIIDLDEKTLAAEGWPVPRAKMAVLTQQLFEHYHVRVLGFDVVYSEADQSAGAALLAQLARGPLADLPGFSERAEQLAPQMDGDGAFAKAIAGKPVVLGTFFKQHVPQGEAAQLGAICAPAIAAEARKLYAVDFIHADGDVGNLPVLQAATPYCGFFDNKQSLDDDGIIRRVPLLQEYDGAIYPSLALAITSVALGNPGVELEFDPPEVRNSLHLERVRVGEVSAAVDGDASVYVPYRGHAYSFNYVSATDVLHGNADANVLKDAIAIVGTSAGGLLDLRSTPVDKAYPGVEVHANVVSGLLEGRIRQKAPYYSGITTVILLAIAALMALWYPRLSPLLGAALVAGLLAAEIVLALLFWIKGNFIIPLGIPMVFTLAVFLAQLLIGYFWEQRQGRNIARKFGQYVHPSLVEEMAASGEEISTTGETREMTVLFSDVRSFTSISEQFKDRPAELTAMMNEFLDALTSVIFRHRGAIDKYVGDMVMCFWGAPAKSADHALNALQAAVEFPKALRALDERFAAKGWPPLQIGVGLNTGPMTVGNMGSSFRVAYTVLGDPVNLASRLEGLTKEYGVSVICGEATRAGAPGWGFRELDLVRVKGKNEPVAIFEPLGPKESVDEITRKDLTRYRQALRAFRAQQWDEAEREFFGLSRSGNPHPVYDLYLSRIAHLRSFPPGPNWDGATTFKTK